MTTIDRNGGPHPDDLLSQYALDTLSEAEAPGLEAHLELCHACRDEVASLRETAAWLSGYVEVQMPPPDLQSSLMAA